MELTAYWEGDYRVRVPVRGFEIVSDEPSEWGGNDEGHFVLVELKGDRMKVVPYGNLADEALRPIKINVVTGDANVPPFEVER